MYVNIGLLAENGNRVERLIGTESGTKLINKFFVHPTLASHVKQRDFWMLRSANKQLSRSEGIVLLHLQIGDLRILVWFGVFKRLDINLLPDTLFIDLYVQNILPMERMLVQGHSWPVESLTQSWKRSYAVSFANLEHASALANKTDRKVALAKPVTLTSRFHTTATVMSTSLGILIVRQKTDFSARPC